VDLNAFLYQMEVHIASFAGVLCDTPMQQRFLDKAKERRDIIEEFMWDEKSSRQLNRSLSFYVEVYVECLFELFV
jgi:neutral trehalase